MINIFIGLSNNQISNYELLLPNLKGDVNVLITENSDYENKLGFSKIILAEGSLKNQATGFFNSLKNIINKIKVYKKVIAELNRLTYARISTNKIKQIAKFLSSKGFNLNLITFIFLKKIPNIFL